MKRFFKIFFLILLILFILIQFYPRPEKNSGQSYNKNDISATYNTTPAVQNILKNSCYDCHSNKTVYPWYSYLQPVAGWLGNHIIEGKKELNFSEFDTYSPRKKFKKLDEIIREVEEDKMPLESYTFIHYNAKLDSAEKAQILNWAKNNYDGMKEKYPADSLKRKN